MLYWDRGFAPIVLKTLGFANVSLKIRAGPLSIDWIEGEAFYISARETEFPLWFTWFIRAAPLFFVISCRETKGFPYDKGLCPL